MKGISSSLRLVFTGKGVGVRVKSPSDLEKFGVVSGITMVPLSSDSAYDSDAYDLVKTRLSKS